MTFCRKKRLTLEFELGEFLGLDGFFGVGNLKYAAAQEIGVILNGRDRLHELIVHIAPALDAAGKARVFQQQGLVAYTVAGVEYAINTSLRHDFIDPKIWRRWFLVLFH
jgi:hypothetical protein